MGDGNHSLATAKAIWEKIKPQVGMNHPARYALVEIENVHDEGLEFEPIHRVLFHVQQNLAESLRHYFGNKYSLIPCSTEEEMVAKVEGQSGPEQLIGLCSVGGYQILAIKDPSSNLPVGTLQGFIDQWLKKGGAEKIDYVHGKDVVCGLGSQPGNLGFYLPRMPKSDLFKPSSSTARCRARPSRWAKPKRSASTWKPARSPSDDAESCKSNQLRCLR